MRVAERSKFLYPEAKMYAFDVVCRQIIDELEKRNWSVPKITVKFRDFGTGEEKFRQVASIEGENFYLYFSRAQGSLGKQTNTAAVTELVVERRCLRVHGDERSPELYVYTGSRDWQQDRRSFRHLHGDDGILNGKSGKYLLYRAGCQCGGHVHSHDIAYPPVFMLAPRQTLTRSQRNEALRYKAPTVFFEFTEWLKTNVLQPILCHDETDKLEEDYLPQPVVFKALFCFGSLSDAERVSAGHANPSALEPSERYGFLPDGYSLLLSGVDGVPREVYQGFRWAGFGNVEAHTDIDDLQIPGYHRWSDKDTFVFRLKPKDATGLFVADNAPYERRREELMRNIAPERTRLTEEELQQAELARALSFLPLVQYEEGRYEQPILLIGRELGLDEVELVSGPWPEYIALKHLYLEETLTEVVKSGIAALQELLEGFNARKEEIHTPSERYEAAVDEIVRFLEADAVCLEVIRSRLRRNVKPNKDLVGRLLSAALQANRLGLVK